jgi:hypothetical protein
MVPGKDLYPSNVPVTVTFSTRKNLTVYAPNDPTGIHPTDAYTISIGPYSIQIKLPPEVLLLKIVDQQ